MDIMKAVRVWCKQHIWFSIKHITRHPLRKIKVKYRLACWPTSSYTYFVFDESGIRGSFVTMWPQVYIFQKISFHSFLKPIFALFEIPYPGYKGRHGRVFFIFVEVDKNFCIWYNQASFIISFCLETDVSQKLPYFLSKFLPCAALCRIVRKSGCECTLQTWFSSLRPFMFESEILADNINQYYTELLRLKPSEAPIFLPRRFWPILRSVFAVAGWIVGPYWELKCMVI